MTLVLATLIVFLRYILELVYYCTRFFGICAVVCVRGWRFRFDSTRELATLRAAPQTRLRSRMRAFFSARSFDDMLVVVATDRRRRSASARRRRWFVVHAVFRVVTVFETRRFDFRSVCQLWRMDSDLMFVLGMDLSRCASGCALALALRGVARS